MSIQLRQVMKYSLAKAITRHSRMNTSGRPNRSKAMRSRARGLVVVVREVAVGLARILAFMRRDSTRLPGRGRYRC
ncbi:hypothetical protein D3C75_905320 [compost metagenome]